MNSIYVHNKKHEFFHLKNGANTKKALSLKSLDYKISPNLFYQYYYSQADYNITAKWVMELFFKEGNKTMHSTVSEKSSSQSESNTHVEQEHLSDEPNRREWYKTGVQEPGWLGKLGTRRMWLSLRQAVLLRTPVSEWKHSASSSSIFLQSTYFCLIIFSLSSKQMCSGQTNVF